MAGWGREQDLVTMSIEAIMERVQTLTALPSADRRSAQETGDDQGYEPSPNGEGFVPGNMNTTPSERAMQRIASLPPVRQSKVLDLRRRIADGTYELAERLDKAIERVLKSISR
jgi:hypothetical protein